MVMLVVMRKLTVRQNMAVSKRMTVAKKLIILIIVCTVLCGVGAGVYALFYFHLIPQKTYTGEDFGIKRIISTVDYDGDGIDDLTDILQGARAYLKTNPKYKSAYYAGGYPPDGEGVCTDVIWKAFKNAGYSLKDLVDADIKSDPDAYPGVNGSPDPNIDFRRVRNLKVFFEHNALSLTTDTADIAQWQPGDIVVFEGHIAIVSDKRNKKGVPYILHNAGQPVKEEDAMSSFTVTGHYRWVGIQQNLQSQ